MQILGEHRRTGIGLDQKRAITSVRITHPVLCNINYQEQKGRSYRALAWLYCFVHAPRYHRAPSSMYVELAKTLSRHHPLRSEDSRQGRTSAGRGTMSGATIHHGTISYEAYHDCAGHACNEQECDDPHSDWPAILQESKPCLNPTCLIVVRCREKTHGRLSTIHLHLSTS
jgi:hypothetical protein